MLKMTRKWPTHIIIYDLFDFTDMGNSTMSSVRKEIFEKSLHMKLYPLLHC